MGFDDNEKLTEAKGFTLSEEDLKMLHRMVKLGGSRQAVLIGLHVIGVTQDRKPIIYDSIDAIGKPVGLGSHVYDRTVMWSWWQDAFKQFDEWLETQPREVSQKEKMRQAHENFLKAKKESEVRNDP